MAKIKKEENEENKGEVDANADKNLLSNLLKANKEDHYNYEERVEWRISTGSLLLDSATGGVSPSLWRLCGNNNSGKTPQMLEIVRNFLKDVPNSKALWVIAEGRGLSEENRQRCQLKFVYKPEDWDVGTVFVLESNIFELFINTVKTLVKDNPNKVKYAFVVDSVDGLILRDDSKKEITESSRVAGVPMLSKKMLQSLSLGMFKFGHFMGLISQVTSEIKLDPYTKTPNRGGTFSGGNSLLHGSDYIVSYEPSYASDFILDNPNGKFNDGKSIPIGQNVKIILSKSGKESSKKTQIIYPVKYGRKPSGIWVEREIGDLVLQWELAKKAGAWITFTPSFIEEVKSSGIEIVEKIQGIDNFYAFFETNQLLVEYLVKKFKNIL